MSSCRVVSAPFTPIAKGVNTLLKKNNVAGVQAYIETLIKAFGKYLALTRTHTHRIAHLTAAPRRMGKNERAVYLA